MRQFFRGWKRKLGCVTLVLACVLAVAWIRSVSTYDAVALPFHFGVATWNGGHMVGRIQLMPIPTIIYGQEDPPVTGWPLISTATGTFEFIPPVMTLRYRWIVLPLTVLSAWLLQAKPRTKMDPPTASTSENA